MNVQRWYEETEQRAQEYSDRQKERRAECHAAYLRFQAKRNLPVAEDIVLASLRKQYRWENFRRRVKANWVLAAAFVFVATACIFMVLALTGVIQP